MGFVIFGKDKQSFLHWMYLQPVQTSIDNQTYYVFLLNGIESKSGFAGYMALKSQYGFIYSGNIDTRT
jgi:hypothetical protein